MINDHSFNQIEKNNNKKINIENIGNKKKKREKTREKKTAAAETSQPSNPHVYRKFEQTIQMMKNITIKKKIRIHIYKVTLNKKECLFNYVLVLI